MTYEVDGEQYVATLVGWGGSYAILGGRLSTISGPQRNISRLLVYKLGGTATLPPPPAEEVKVLDPPKQTASPAIVTEGKKLYGRNCVYVSWRRCDQRRTQSGSALQQAAR